MVDERLFPIFGPFGEAAEKSSPVPQPLRTAVWRTPAPGAGNSAGPRKHAETGVGVGSIRGTVQRVIHEVECLTAQVELPAFGHVKGFDDGEIGRHVIHLPQPWKTIG